MSNTNVGNIRGRYFGKYRGKVVENVDPMVMGRILASVPAVPSVKSTWAMPCVPYAGPQVGFYTMPPIGANVWIEFEGGDPNYPIWVGCFWSEGELPLEAPPEMKVFKTEFNTFILNDTPEEGGMTLTSIPDCVDDLCSLTFDAEGIQLKIPESSIDMTTGTISATTGNISMTAEEGIEAKATADISLTAEGAISSTASGDITEKATGAVNVSAGGDASFKAGGATEVSAGGDVSVSGGGAAEVTGGGDLTLSGGGAAELSGGGDCSISGGGATEVSAGLDVAIQAGLACELTAGADCAITAIGATEVTASGVAITGATEVTGALTIDGDVPMMAPA